ncbi:hypothetical protein EMCRGX_G003209 [Ephydatia muelleri]
MAVALALTKLRFSLPYKAARTSALALLELHVVARREARSENDSIASVPQAPYASTTMGMQIHPSSLIIYIVFSLLISPLQPPTNFSVIVSNTSNTTFLLSWGAPFSLDVTDSPDIYNYTLCTNITIYGCRNISSNPDCIFSGTNQCNSSVDFTDHSLNGTNGEQNDSILFTFFAVNGAGNGTKANFTYLFKKESGENLAPSQTEQKSKNIVPTMTTLLSNHKSENLILEFAVPVVVCILIVGVLIIVIVIKRHGTKRTSSDVVVSTEKLQLQIKFKPRIQIPEAILMLNVIQLSPFLLPIMRFSTVNPFFAFASTITPQCTKLSPTVLVHETIEAECNLDNSHILKDDQSYTDSTNDEQDDCVSNKVAGPIIFEATTAFVENGPPWMPLTVNIQQCEWLPWDRLPFYTTGKASPYRKQWPQKRSREVSVSGRYDYWLWFYKNMHNFSCASYLGFLKDAGPAQLLEGGSIGVELADLSCKVCCTSLVTRLIYDGRAVG